MCHPTAVRSQRKATPRPAATPHRTEFRRPSLRSPVSLRQVPLARQGRQDALVARRPWRRIQAQSSLPVRVRRNCPPRSRTRPWQSVPVRGPAGRRWHAARLRVRRNTSASGRGAQHERGAPARRGICATIRRRGMSASGRLEVKRGCLLAREAQGRPGKLRPQHRAGCRSGHPAGRRPRRASGPRLPGQAETTAPRRFRARLSGRAERPRPIGTMRRAPRTPDRQSLQRRPANGTTRPRRRPLTGCRALAPHPPARPVRRADQAQALSAPLRVRG